MHAAHTKPSKNPPSMPSAKTTGSAAPITAKYTKRESSTGQLRTATRAARRVTEA